ncbi:MAG: GAF domain-containing protein [Pseudanabaenales cyanobacterium]|nr:GAF domain-containing protein [Pseudanabaenales cyanobacterium]
MQNRILRRGLLTILGFSASAALAGIIGNRVDANLDKVWPLLGQPMQISIGTGILIFLFCSIPALILSLRYAEALETTAGIIKLDESLLRLVPDIYRYSEDIEERLKRTVKKLFKDLVKLKNFEDCGVALYRPNQQGNFLVTWARYSNPNETDETLTFFIGDEISKNSPTGRGVAGTSYVEKRTIVVHIDSKGYADNNIYTPSPSGRVGYRSLICVPVLGESDCVLAVLCLYSSQTNTFDKSEMRKVIGGIAGKFSTILLIGSLASERWLNAEYELNK